MVKYLCKGMMGLSLVGVMLGSGVAYADLNLAIQDATPQIYADYPFVYPLTGKPYDLESWQMTYANVSSDYINGTNFASLTHAVSGSHHTGEDWLVNQSSYQSQGKSIYAINHGVVVYAGIHLTGTRYVVIIRHRAPLNRPFKIPKYETSVGGYDYQREATDSEVIYSYYLHLDKELPVQAGDYVYKGQVIGKTYQSNDPNAAYPPHLHFEIWTRLNMDGENVNDSAGYDPPAVFKSRLPKLIEPVAFIRENNCGVDPNNCRPTVKQAAIESNTLTIKGKGFGSGPGKVTIYAVFFQKSAYSDYSNVFHEVTQGFSVWSDDTVQLTLPASAFPDQLISKGVYRIWVRRSDDTKSNTKVYPFTDVEIPEWFTEFVVDLRLNGVIQGKTDPSIEAGDAPSSFAPLHKVQRDEFVKMLMTAYGRAHNEPEPPYPSAPPFPDVPTNEWFSPYVAKAKALGFISGDPSGNFNPTAFTNRAEAAKMLVLAMGKKEGDASCQSAPFSDVAQGVWYYPWACLAKEAKVFEGKGGNYFKGGDELLRAEAAKVIQRTFFSSN